MSTPKTFTLYSILTEEQISDTYIAYYREKQLGDAGNVHAGIVRAITPYMAGIDLITGQQNDIDYIAYGIELGFDQRVTNATFHPSVRVRPTPIPPT